MTDAKPMIDKLEVEVNETRAESMARAIFRAATPQDSSLKADSQKPPQTDSAD